MMDPTYVQAEVERIDELLREATERARALLDDIADPPTPLAGVPENDTRPNTAYVADLAFPCEIDLPERGWRLVTAASYDPALNVWDLLGTWGEATVSHKVAVRWRPYTGCPFCQRPVDDADPSVVRLRTVRAHRECWTQHEIDVAAERLLTAEPTDGDAIERTAS